MSNRRKLKPHEIARRDQSLAWASEHAAAGDLVMVVESIPAGRQCCWCDCPDVPSSPHITVPGYVCGNVCPEQAAYMVQASHGGRQIIAYPVCGRHQTGPLAQLTALGVVGEVLIGPSWRDD